MMRHCFHQFEVDLRKTTKKQQQQQQALVVVVVVVDDEMKRKKKVLRVSSCSFWELVGLDL